jgi:hypothetical protein
VSRELDGVLPDLLLVRLQFFATRRCCEIQGSLRSASADANASVEMTSYGVVPQEKQIPFGNDRKKNKGNSNADL